MKKISIKSLESRIRRVLSIQNQKLMKLRPRWHSGYGEYAIVDATSNQLIRWHVCIDDLANELGVLHENQEIAFSA